MENPYQSPSESETPNRPSTGLRSYHVPFIIAAVCGLTLAVLSSITFVDQHTFAVCFAVIMTILVFDLPVCGLVLWELMSTGEPPELNLEPLFPGAERLALYRAWKERPQLDDEAFYQAFFADSGISRWIVARVRREMQGILGGSLAGVRPGDDLVAAAPELDFTDVFYRFERVFRIVIPWRTGEVSYKGGGEFSFDGTFDSLVRLVAACIARKDRAE